jgi:alkanesulfonate monooxygenase SsuD/methylene tetrahydromethanopterin reductase-like flavin-dependent oxidoreductase (luciferase family)
MDRRGEARLVARRGVRFRRPLSAAQERPRLSEAIRQYPAASDECRLVRRGEAFALRNCDAFFVATAGSRTSLAGNAAKVAEIKAAASALGRQIEVFTVGQVICRPSQREAEDYYRHVNIEHADWDAIDGMLANKSITPQTIGAQEYDKKRRYFAANAIGGYPFVGTPDRIAEKLAIISQAGVRGIGLSFVSYLAEVP